MKYTLRNYFLESSCERAQRTSYLVVSKPRYISTDAAFLNGRCSDQSKHALSRLYVILNTRKSNFAMCDYTCTCTRTFHAAALALARVHSLVLVYKYTNVFDNDVIL